MACESRGIEISDHFADIGKMVDLRSGSQREKIIMKILLIISLLTLASLTSWSQPDTIFKQKKVPKVIGIEEQFYVLKTDRDIKYGPYVKYMLGTNRFFIIEAGRYVNNKKEDKWSYFYYGSTTDQIEAQGYFKNDQKNGYWEYFYYDYALDTVRNKSRLYSQTKTKRDEYSISVSIKSIKKSSGNYLNNSKVGAWNYFDRKGALMLIIDHSKDSVLFLDPSKLPSESFENGSYKPFFIGGKEYFEIMMNRYSINEINKTGVIGYLLQVDKNTIANNLVEKMNTSSKNTEAGFKKRLSTMINDWIPKIDGNKIVTSELQLVITITTEHFDSHVILKTNPYVGYNSSSDFFRFKIEMK